MAEAAPSGTADTDDSGGSTRRCVVLLVDDQEFVAESIRRMLADQPDIELHYCPEPGHVIRAARAIGATVILQDLVMPNADGLMMVRFLRAASDTRGIPIIVLSSKEHPLDKSAAFSAGATDYLVKLPDKIELVARIRAHSRSFIAQQQRDEALRSLRLLKQQLEESNEALRRMTNTDGLTGIANRRRFDEAFDVEWRRASREGTCLSAILLDVDHFKAYNDGLGHQQGDACLQAVAGALASSARRPADLVARYGGEEFVALLPNTDAAGARKVAERMRAAVSDARLAHPRSSTGPFVTISLGAATMAPREGASPKLLLEQADAALYEAKRSGRNRVCQAPELTGEVATRA